MRLNWEREPLKGGVRYYAEEAEGLWVEGLYEWPDFEADCPSWEASNVCWRTFPTADAAMRAAELEHFYARGPAPTIVLPTED